MDCDQSAVRPPAATRRGSLPVVVIGANALNTPEE